MKKNLGQINFIIAVLALAIGVFNAFSKTSVKHDKFMLKTIERVDSLGGDTTLIVTKDEVYNAIVALNYRAPSHDAIVNLFAPFAINALDELITQLELTDSTGTSLLTYEGFVNQQLEKSRRAQERAAQEDQSAKDAEIERLKAQLEEAKKQ